MRDRFDEEDHLRSSRRKILSSSSGIKRAHSRRHHNKYRWGNANVRPRPREKPEIYDPHTTYLEIPTRVWIHNCSRQPSRSRVPAQPLHRWNMASELWKFSAILAQNQCTYSSSSIFIETRGLKWKLCDVTPQFPKCRRLLWKLYGRRTYDLGSFSFSVGTNRISNVELSDTTLFYNDISISFLTFLKDLWRDHRGFPTIVMWGGKHSRIYNTPSYLQKTQRNRFEVRVMRA